MPDAATAGPDLRPGRPHGARWRAWALAAALLGAPPLFHLLGADLASLALLWCATALQFRSRLTVLDRLVLAAGLLTGWLCLLGVLASYGRWGLQPVTLAEATALPLAILLLALNRDPFAVRLRLPSGDWLLLLAVAVAGWFYLRPLLTTDVTGRLAAIYHGEDLARHFALYDSVLRFGGYLTVHRAQAAVTLQDGFQTYPQGSHLTLAVLTVFAHNGHVPADAPTALGAFILLTAGVLTAFVGAVLWAACRAAGPALGGWAVLPLCALVGGYLVLVEATPLLLVGFESEIFGLVLFALLAALVVRPLGRPGEQLLLLGSLTVGVSFSYYLLLAAALPLLLVWAVLHRRRLPGRRLTLPAAVLTGAAAALPVLANWKQANSAAVLVMQGGVLSVSRHLLLPLIALAVLGLLAAAARHNAVRRAALGTVAVVSAVALGLMWYQIAAAGRTSYYYEKLLHPLFVVTLVALGAAVVPVFGAPERRRRAGLPVRAAWAVLAAAAVLFAVALNSRPDNGKHSSAEVYWNGERAAPASAALVMAVNATRPVPDSRIGLLLVEPHAGEDPRFAEGNLWLGILARDNGLSWRAWIWGRRHRGPQEIVDYADASPVPMRVYLDDPALAADTVRLAGPGRRAELEIALIRYDANGRPVVVDPFELTGPEQR